MPEIIIQSEEQWRQLRRTNVGSSDIAALFGISPYKTEFALYHEKVSGAELEISSNRMEEGKWLEPVIAARLAETKGWDIVRAQPYVTHPTDDGMAATLDYWVTDPERGPGIMEIKLVRWSIWRDQWTATRPPAHLALQLQHQFSCTGFAWGGIGTLVVGEGPLDPLWYPAHPDQAVIAAIEERVAEFWADVRSGKTPPATGTDREYALLRQLHPVIAPKKVIELDDHSLAEEARLMRWAHEQASGHDRTVTAIRTKLAAAMGDAELLHLPETGVSRKKHGKGWRFEVFDRAAAGGGANTIFAAG